jgi:hypothetical protein
MTETPLLRTPQTEDQLVQQPLGRVKNGMNQDQTSDSIGVDRVCREQERCCKADDASTLCATQQNTQNALKKNDDPSI